MWKRLLSLRHNLSICWFHVRFSSRIRPKNVIEGVLLISKSMNLIESGRFGIIFLLDLKIVKVDLSVFKVILLEVNHSLRAVIIILPVEIRSPMFLQWKNTFVSSAKILKLPSGLQLGRSLMKMRKKRGPSTEPWGTPHVTDRVWD